MNRPHATPTSAGCSRQQPILPHRHIAPLSSPTPSTCLQATHNNPCALLCSEQTTQSPRTCAPATPRAAATNATQITQIIPHRPFPPLMAHPAGNVILKDVYPCGSEGGCLNVRVVDFGCSQLVVPGTPLRGMSGSPLFVAPEIIGGAYGLPADM